MAGVTQLELTGRYIFALGLVGLFSLAAYLLAYNVTTRSVSNAAEVNISGRQRMLSPRVAGLAVQMAVATENAEKLRLRKLLADSLDLMEHSHQAIISGGEEMGLPAELSRQLRPYYFEPPLELHRQVEAFISQARGFLEDGGFADDPRLEALLATANEYLLVSLDTVTSRFQQAGRENIRLIQQVQVLTLAVILMLLVAVGYLIMKPMVHDVCQTHQALEELSCTDALTQALNRRRFEEIFHIECERSRRFHTPLTLILYDIDHFKNINDKLGHAAGDAVLVELTRLVGATVRRIDHLVRWGGEEFLILSPGANMDGGMQLAEKIRNLASGHDFEQGSAITISLGVAEFLAGESEEAFFKRTDDALYAAKRAGRNCVKAA